MTDPRDALEKAKAMQKSIDQVNRMYERERDPERIERIVDNLEKLWKRYPDWRLCQLLLNVTDKHAPTFFYVDDDVVEDRIAEWLENPPFRGIHDVKTDKV